MYKSWPTIFSDLAVLLPVSVFFPDKEGLSLSHYLRAGEIRRSLRISQKIVNFLLKFDEIFTIF